jgi:hypothetical protein
LGRTNPARADGDRPGRRELPDLSDAALCSKVERAQHQHATVRAWTGVPTSIGLGPTKPCLRKRWRRTLNNSGRSCGAKDWKPINVTVFYHTSEHDRDERMRSVSTRVQLPEHSSDTLAPIRAVRHRVALPWRAAMTLQQGGDRHDRPRAAVTRPTGADRRAGSGGATPLMVALDACNARWSRSTAVPAWVIRCDWNTKV